MKLLALPFLRFVKELRVHKAWNYKIPLLLSFTYLIVYMGEVGTQIFTLSIICSYLTILGFAGTAYLINDYSDKEPDLVSGKQNFFSTRLYKHFFVYLLFFVLIALLPWLYLPIDKLSIFLIALQFTSYILYSFRPFRFKEKGVLGLLCDTLYAHVIPAILAIHTFYLIIGERLIDHIDIVLVVVVWQFFSGMRNIYSHQYEDLNNDLKSSTNTWVTNFSYENRNRIYKTLIALEVLSFISFLFVVAPDFILLPITYLLFLITRWLVFAKSREDLNPKAFTNILLDEFYIKWIPILILISIIPQKTSVSIVLILHLIFFPHGIATIFKSFIKNSKLLNFLNAMKFLLFEEKVGFWRVWFRHIMVLVCYLSIFIGVYFTLAHYISDFEPFFFYQRLLSIGFLIVLCLHGVSFFFFQKEDTVHKIKGLVFHKSTALNLAIFRIIFFLFVIDSLYPFSNLNSLKAWSHRPKSSMVSLPGIGWLMELIPVSPVLYEAAIYAGLFLAVCSMLGLGTKYVIKIFIPVAFYIWAVPCFYGKLNHNHIILWVSIIMAFSKCADVLSIDALFRKSFLKNGRNTSCEYGIPFAFIWIQLALIYFFSGIHKLWDVGLYWALSENLVNQVMLEWVENYDVVLGFRIDDYPIVAKMGAVCVVLFEILYPVFLLSSRTRWINLIGAWVLHLSAGYLLNIDFLSLRKTSLSYVNWTSIFRKKKLRLSEHNGLSLQAPVHYTNYLRKTVFIVPLILVAGNFCCGLMNISSWPFSAYPSYTSIVHDEVELLEFYAFAKSGTAIDIKAMGKQQNFRWENIRIFENEIAELHHAKGSSTEVALQRYWQLWENNISEAEEVDCVDFYIEVTKLKPELREVVIKREFVGSLKASE